MKKLINRSGGWLALLLLTDITCVVLVWILRPDAIGQVGVFLLLFTLLLVTAGVLLERHARRKKSAALRALLDAPNETSTAALCAALGAVEQPLVEELSSRLCEQERQLAEKQQELQNYREYIEEWTHELKTPLSLMTLVLENHAQEISPYVAARMQYASRQIEQNVQQILYYARLQAQHADYLFTRFALVDCVQEVVEQFAPLAAERKTEITCDIKELTVVSDRRLLAFLLSQLLSNAIKYADAADGRVCISATRKMDEIRLSVRDNGTGAAPEDLPFLFDKGFTGSHTGRRKATGMGLYLVGKYAPVLSVKVQPETALPAGFGFGMQLLFPVVAEPENA